MAKIRLVYFDARGRAEISRLILAQAGVDYEDVRIDVNDWPSKKDKVPTGQLPALEYNGQVLCQSLAIARFLAKENGLGGKDNWEQARVDMVADCIADVAERAIQIKKIDDADKRKEEAVKFKEGGLKKFMELSEAMLTKNGGKFMVGNQLTWADLLMAHVLYQSGDKVKDIIDIQAVKEKFPNLNNLVKMVGNLPNIKKWVETRPQTER